MPFLNRCGQRKDTLSLTDTVFHEPCQAAEFPKDALSLPQHWHVSRHVVTSLSINEILHNSYGYSREATQIANTKIYMDDKTSVDPAYQRCLDRASAWETWSSTVGLLESSDEAQALAKTKAMQDKLVVDRPQWSQEKTMQVLGVSIRARPSKNTAVESQRIAAAVTRSKLLGCLLVSFRRKLELYKVFVVPKALFRMFQRFVA